MRKSLDLAQRNRGWIRATCHRELCRTNNRMITFRNRAKMPDVRREIDLFFFFPARMTDGRTHVRRTAT